MDTDVLVFTREKSCRYEGASYMKVAKAYRIDNDYLEKYNAHQIADLKAKGATQAQIAKAVADAAAFTKLYKNPFINAAYTYMEILPVGLVVSVLAAVILKRKAAPDNMVMTS